MLFRSLPIHPDYTVRRVDVPQEASIDVVLTNDELWAKVVTTSDTETSP